MRALRVVLLTLLTVGLLGAAAFGAVVVLQPDGEPRAATDSPMGQPEESPDVPSETPSPSDEPSETPKPEFRLDSGDRGVKVRELQSRLHQLDWLPELTTGKYDARDPRGSERLPGQAPPEGHRRRRRADLAATGRDDQDAHARPALQRPAPRPRHPRGRCRRRAGARPPGPPGLDRVAVRRRDRHVRRRDGRGGPRLPGEARDPGHRQGRPAHAGPAARDDLPAVVRADAQHHARSRARSTRDARPAARCAWTSPRTRCAG